MPEQKDSAIHTAPQVSRPHMPGYGIPDAASGRGLLPWSWAAERLAQSHNYWLSTTRPDARPHAMAVWGIWVEDRFWFSTGRTSRKARNLALNPNCVVCTERADQAVIVEGVAEEIAPSLLPAQVAESYQAKYQWALDPNLGPIFAVRPRVVFAFIESIENPDDFVSTATRWTFTEQL